MWNASLYLADWLVAISVSLDIEACGLYEGGGPYISGRGRLLTLGLILLRDVTIDLPLFFDLLTFGGTDRLVSILALAMEPAEVIPAVVVAEAVEWPWTLAVDWACALDPKCALAVAWAVDPGCLDAAALALALSLSLLLLWPC